MFVWPASLSIGAEGSSADRTVHPRSRVDGARGGQGWSIVDKALRRCIRVRALVRNPNSMSARQFAEAGAEIAQSDFADFAFMRRAKKSVGAVFSMQQDGAPPSLLDAAIGKGVQRFIHSTVSGMYVKQRSRELRHERAERRVSALRPLLKQNSRI